MAQPLAIGIAEIASPDEANEVTASGVSWAAVIAGAIVTAALSLILLALGAGLGLSAVSPWSGFGVSSTTIGTGVVIWLLLMQIMSGSLGGYLAGRLRTTWPTIHTDEVYFRDTAHGFLSWGVAVVLTAAFLASAATAMVGSVKSTGGMTEERRAQGRNRLRRHSTRSQHLAPSDTKSVVIRGENDGNHSKVYPEQPSLVSPLSSYGINLSSFANCTACVRRRVSARTRLKKIRLECVLTVFLAHMDPVARSPCCSTRWSTIASVGATSGRKARPHRVDKRRASW